MIDVESKRCAGDRESFESFERAGADRKCILNVGLSLNSGLLDGASFLVLDAVLQ